VTCLYILYAWTITDSTESIRKKVKGKSAEEDNMEEEDTIIA
jgi:hypothetical protein